MIAGRNENIGKTKREILKGVYFILNLGPGGFSEMPIWLEGIMANGVRIIQVRGKELHPMKLAAEVRSVVKLAKRYNVPVIVNDFPKIALSTGAFGVHLGMKDTSIVQARLILGAEVVIGATVRNITQAERAIKAGADYIAVGSIFKSPTKPGAPVVGPEVIAGIKAEFPNTPLCAIGGINAGNIMTVFQAGADMVAVISAIAGAENPEREAFILATAMTAKKIDEKVEKYDWEEVLFDRGREDLDD